MRLFKIGWFDNADIRFFARKTVADLGWRETVVGVKAKSTLATPERSFAVREAK